MNDIHIHLFGYTFFILFLFFFFPALFFHKLVPINIQMFYFSHFPDINGAILPNVSYIPLNAQASVIQCFLSTISASLSWPFHQSFTICYRPINSSKLFSPPSTTCSNYVLGKYYCLWWQGWLPFLHENDWTEHDMQSTL